MQPKSDAPSRIRSWLTQVMRAYSAIKKTKGTVVAVGTAIIAVGTVVTTLSVVTTQAIQFWQWLNDPKDSRISLIYQQIGEAPVVALLAKNDGNRPGHIVKALIFVEWEKEGKRLGFGFPLRIVTPEPVYPGEVPMNLGIAVLGGLVKFENTSQEDTKKLLEPAKDEQPNTAFTQAQCMLVYIVATAKGAQETKSAPVSPCLPLYKWFVHFAH